MVKIEGGQAVTAIRKFYEEEIESMIRQMKIEGGSLDECSRELRLLADFVRSKAEELQGQWPDLLKGTVYEMQQQTLRSNED